MAKQDAHQAITRVRQAVEDYRLVLTAAEELAQRALEPLKRDLEQARAAGVSEKEIRRVLAELGGAPSAEEIFEAATAGGSQRRGKTSTAAR